jgi:bifunctional UDP-N-acetylglucosamine pyrophosphorylase/glucosamine-1-phosphate N-acetyltransferase
MAEPLYRGVAGRDVLVLAGDMPLLRCSTLVKLLARHRAQSAAASVATGELEDPAGYGRIVRDAAGAFERIVEHKDATDAQRAIREVNPSCYCFDSARLFEALAQVDSNNSQGEFYVTDVLGILREAGHTVIAVNAVGPDEVEGINSPEQLARVDQTLRQRQDEGAAP